MTVVMLASKKV